MKRYVCMVLLLGLCVGIFTWLAYYYLGCPKAGIDDADIFFVYSRNLAHGHGLVYNVGGEKVEGFSSILWMLIGAFLFKLTDHIEGWLMLINVIAQFVGLLAVLKYIETKSEVGRGFCISWLGGCFLVWVFAGPAYVCWTTFSLMETGLWSMLFIVTTLHLVSTIEKQDYNWRRTITYTVLLVLILVSRPEGMIWSGLFAVLFVTGALICGQQIKKIATIVGTLVVSVLLLHAIRFIYFGYLFPNTYYAKVSPDAVYTIRKGLAYLTRFLVSNGLLPIFVAATFWQLLKQSWILVKDGLCHNRPFGSSYASVATAMIVVFGLMLPVMEGGDHFGMFRFYQPLWPLLYLPFFQFVHPFILRRVCCLKKTWPVGLCAISFTLLLVLAVRRDRWVDLGEGSFKYEFKLSEEGRRTGQLLSDMFSRTASLPSIGVVTAGGIKYKYSGEIVDLMGLNNVVMAHDRGNRHGVTGHAAFSREIFYQLKPQVICPTVMPYPFVTRSYYVDPWFNVPLKGLLTNEQFRSEYALVAVKEKSTEKSLCITGYFRREYLAKLMALNSIEYVTLVQNM